MTDSNAPSTLDLVFCMDCTGSMGSYIEAARTSIAKIVEDIVASEKSDVRFALVGYRDHPPQERSWVTKIFDFTASVTKMRTQLSSVSASGGGDCPEAVADALHAALKLDWRSDATKIAVLVADAPPHGLDPSAGDHWPQGCPSGLDPMVIAQQMATKGIILYSVGCEPSAVSWREWFSAVAHTTGGRYVPLGNASLLAGVIVGGAQEEIALERAMQEVQEEVENELDDGVDEEELAKKIKERLEVRGVKAKKLVAGGEELAAVTETAKTWSQMDSMAAVQSEYVKSAKPKATYRAPRMKMSMPSSAAGGSLEEEAAFMPSLDAYESVASEVTMEQSSRMVQKIKMRKKRS